MENSSLTNQSSLKLSKRKRIYFDENFSPSDKNTLKREFENLLAMQIKNRAELITFLEKCGELSDIIGEEYAWKYINMTRFADNQDYQKEFNEFYSNSISLSMSYDFELKKKFYESPFRNELEEPSFKHLNRIIANDIEIFREENVPLFVKEREVSNKYGEVISKIVINFKGTEKTFNQMNVFLKDKDRSVREEAWNAKYTNLREHAEELDAIFDELKEIRNKEAKNAGFDNYRDYKHKEKGRFSYTPDDLMQFHKAVEDIVVPFVKERNEVRKNKLNLDTLRPWDTSVETDGDTLKPFVQIEEFTDKAIQTLTDADKDFGMNLATMKASGFLDLENRKGKAPGGYTFGLPEYGSSFIFMNAVGVNSDVKTLLHESGHAMHSKLTSPMKISYFKDYPMEVAELASMSMELFTVDHLNHFYNDKEQLKKAKLEQLEGALSFLPWCMTVDAFQHWIYTTPHNSTERKAYFENLMERFNGGVEWSGLRDIEQILWMQQLHIFEVPFYYIEYGMSQLGALAVYKNYKLDPEKAVEQYKQFLKLGYSLPVKDLYSAAGIEFNFSEEYIKGIVDFVRDEIRALES
ncbi:MAG: M3 family oligoendopeptidase [Caldisericaceae bacterium]